MFIQNFGNIDSTFSVHTIIDDILIHNLEYFTFNFLACSISSRKEVQLHRPVENFASYQRGVYYLNIKIFHTLPASVAEIIGCKKHFILALERFVIIESFYSINEYLNYQHEKRY
jgi:hypothetical protein